MNTGTDTGIATVLRRDRLVVIAGLAVVIVASWAFILEGAGMRMSAFEMTRMEIQQMERTLSGEATGGMAMQKPVVWTPGFAVLMFFMWWIMMVAMMLPTATPAVLHFAAIGRERREAENPYLQTFLFAFAYLAVWAGFSLLAVVVQWGLQHLGWLSPMLVITRGLLDEIVILAAGLYQFTPWQRAALEHCQSCGDMLSAGWRDGHRGALAMGLAHGVKCLGVCWPLMAMLFVAGIMNVYWIAGISLVILLQKATPFGGWIGYATGAGLIAWGGWYLIAAL